MRHDIVHMIGATNGAELTINGPDVHTRCGKVACPTDGVPSRYKLIDAAGNKFEATTRMRFVSCKKCLNLLTVGTIHVKRPRQSAYAPKCNAVASERS